MTRPARLLAALAIAFAFQSFSRADEPLKLADIIGKCRDALSRLGYVRYTVKGFVKEANAPRLEMTWQEEGEKCRYDYIDRNDDGSENFSSAYSFDGKKSIRTFFGNGTFQVQNGTWDFPPWVQNMEFITAPFEFLVRRKGVPAWQHPNIGLLQSPAMWEWLAKNATLIGLQKYKDRDCMVVQVNNASDRFNSYEQDMITHYVVYFDSKSCMPVAWRQFNQKDRLISELEMVAEQTIQSGKTDLYIAPRQLKVTFYDYASPTAPNAILNYWRYDFGDIAAVPDPDKGFALDLSSASMIHDLDSDTWIDRRASPKIDSKAPRLIYDEKKNVWIPE